MAANRPIAVATSASAMPGATCASVACCTFARLRNACMMPHTVPNRPTYGLTDPLEEIHLALEGGAHRPARAVDHVARFGLLRALLPAQLGELAEARLEDALE